MPAHSAPTSRRQLRTTVLTALATALAALGLMVAGSALTGSPAGQDPVTTAGPVQLVDAPTTVSTTPAVRESEAPRTTTSKPTTSSKKPTTTTTTSADDEDDE
ncbi:hypothetical protein WCD74_01715 [Actinomycetospora sp. OC33-EN08]|uniref:Uncharacterized protein n=1 Tax=Actinomycetospora aurantiaca TaxID=3129233 RepID=A0ABU8MGK8_9PSEU